MVYVQVGCEREGRGEKGEERGERMVHLCRDWLNLVDNVRDAGLNVSMYTRSCLIVLAGGGGLCSMQK